MPEHFHLLFQPVDAGLTSAIVKDIEQRSAAALLQRLSARSWLFSKILWF
jgi:REP element-mobilizing transposase RayT